VVESSGISEPMPVAETFTFAQEGTGRRLDAVARLDTTVTVVDAFNWLRDYDSASTLQERGLAVGGVDEHAVGQHLHPLADALDPLRRGRVLRGAEAHLEHLAAGVRADERGARGQGGGG
jgi:hypothetical protein